MPASLTITTAALQRDLTSFAIGALSVSVALTSLAVYVLRKVRTDKTLLWFGIFGLLYGTRLMVQGGIFLAAVGLSALHGAQISALITFVIQVPASIYALGVIDALHTRIGRVILLIAALLAVFGCVVVIADLNVEAMYRVNNLLVLLFFLPAYVYTYARSRTEDIAIMKIGFALFIASVVADNLSGVGALPTAIRFEPFGFLVLLAAMGTVTARRALHDQERLRSVERELEIARTIQRSILPESVPQLPAFEVAVRYEPMTEVAGDFYDFVQLGGDRLGVLVADVSGHGVPAALIASMLKMAFVGHVADADDPARLLARLNESLCGRFQSHFVTAAYAVFDGVAGRVTYSGAAHPALLVRRADGRVEELQENGLMLGAFGFAQYANASAAFGAGDQLLLYTDGLIEGANARGDEFGSERLQQAFDAAAASSISKLFQAFTEFTRGTAQQDDLTAVAVRRA